MSSGRTPGLDRKTAVGPPGAAWISRKTTTETMPRSSSAWTKRRTSSRATTGWLSELAASRIRTPHSQQFGSWALWSWALWSWELSSDLPLVHVPDESCVGRVALEALEGSRDRVQLGHVVERDLDRQLRDACLGFGEESLALVQPHRAIGGVDEPRERIVHHEIDVPAGRRRPIGGKERRQLGIGRHLPPVQHRVELPLEPELADAGAVVELDRGVDADVAKRALEHLRDVLPDREPGLRDDRERELR